LEAGSVLPSLDSATWLCETFNLVSPRDLGARHNWWACTYDLIIALHIELDFFFYICYLQEFVNNAYKINRPVIEHLVF
jgi:hypothetical protein